MKIPARRGQPAKQCAEVEQALGDQMDDRAFALHLAEHAEQARAEEFAALLLDELGVDDDVGEAAFVCYNQVFRMPQTVTYGLTG